MYGTREYKNALHETRIGISIYDQLEKWATQGVKLQFEVPERSAFKRHIVEYELCAEVLDLKFVPASVAGILELCNRVSFHQDGWNRILDEVISESGDLVERARCLCFQILFAICTVSVGGLRGEIMEVVREQYASRFDDLENEIASENPNIIKDRTWWLLTKGVMSESDSSRCLAQFESRIQNVAHHPLERIQFEKACAELIRVWLREGVVVDDRSVFATNFLELLVTQTERIAKTEALSQKVLERSQELSSVASTLMRELSDKGKIEATDSVFKKVAGFVGDSVEHIVVDTAVAGLRAILGI